MKSHLFGSMLMAMIALLSACSGAEDRLAGYLARGEAFFASGNYDKARVEFSNVLQMDPKNAQARLMAGRIAEKQGNPRDAVGHYQAAIDADASGADARAALGRLYLFGGLPDRALELVETGLALAPDSPQLLTVRAAVKGQSGDKAGALQDAEKAYQSAPSDEYGIALLASLYRRDGRADRAIEILRRGIDSLPENVDLRVILADQEFEQKNPGATEEQLRKIVELQPTSVANWQRLARFNVLTGDVEAAEDAMRSGLKAMPDNLNAKLALVDFIGSQRGAADAEKQLLAFVEEDADNDELKLALGQFHERRGNFDKARATYEEIVAKANLKPSGLTARNRMAAMAARRNDATAAERFIAEVLSENPRDNDALILRANLALARNDSVSAISDLRAVLRDQPTAVPLMRALARAYLQQNDVALAEEALRTASEANPQDATTRLDLASLLVQTSRPEQAQPLLEKLVAEAPDNLQAIETLFRVQAGQKDLVAARATAVNLQRARPDLAMGFYLAGLVEEAEQDMNAATASYEQSLKLQPEGGEPLAALVRLDVARNQPAKAMARIDAVTAQYPDNVVARNLKGELLTSQKRYDEAQAAFNAAVGKAPQWWIPYRGLAIARLAASDLTGATAALRDGFAKTGGAPSLATDLAALLERTNQPEEAIKVYEDLLSRNPGSPAAANNLAMLLASYRTDAASLDRAQQLAERLATATDPNFVNTRGWVRYKRGEYVEALPLLLQAVEKLPDSPVMRYHLGMAQLKTGDKEAARRNLAAAVGANRPFSGIEEARSALEQANRPG